MVIVMQYFPCGLLFHYKMTSFVLLYDYGPPDE